MTISYDRTPGTMGLPVLSPHSINPSNLSELNLFDWMFLTNIIHTTSYTLSRMPSGSPESWILFQQRQIIILSPVAKKKKKTYLQSKTKYPHIIYFFYRTIYCVKRPCIITRPWNAQVWVLVALAAGMSCLHAFPNQNWIKAWGQLDTAYSSSLTRQ